MPGGGKQWLDWGTIQPQMGKGHPNASLLHLTQPVG